MSSPQEILDNALARLIADASVRALHPFTYLFKLGDSGSWLLDCRIPELRKVREGSADCVITSDSLTFQGIASGKLNGQYARATGALSVEGSYAAALYLHRLLSS